MNAHNASMVLVVAIGCAGPRSTRQDIKPAAIQPWPIVQELPPPVPEADAISAPASIPKVVYRPMVTGPTSPTITIQWQQTNETPDMVYWIFSTNAIAPDARTWPVKAVVGHGLRSWQGPGDPEQEYFVIASSNSFGISYSRP